MTLQMLEYFIALAQAQSFTDAAEACFVSQPALSRAIANLEKEMGCALVNRDKRKIVTLTPAGERLLIEARRIMQQIDVMRERVASAHKGSEVTVGYMFYGILQRFRALYKDVLEQLRQEGISVKTVYGTPTEVCERVQSGEIDCALITGADAGQMGDCDVLPFANVTTLVLAAQGHPFFERESVRLDELKEQKFVFFDPIEMPGTYAKNIALCAYGGFEPAIVGYGQKMGDVVNQVHQHSAVAFVSDVCRFVQGSDLKLLTIEEYRSEWDAQFVMIKRKKAIHPAAQRLFEAIAEAAANMDL